MGTYCFSIKRETGNENKNKYNVDYVEKNLIIALDALSHSTSKKKYSMNQAIDTGMHTSVYWTSFMYENYLFRSTNNYYKAKVCLLRYYLCPLSWFKMSFFLNTSLLIIVFQIFILSFYVYISISSKFQSVLSMTIFFKNIGDKLNVHQTSIRSMNQ